MKQVLEGSHAVSEAVRLAKVQVVSAYPITPQTHIVEAISQHCADGTLAARFICVESEHSAMAAVIGAASGGVRTFTATSSHGLALMHELLHWASAARLPIVMAEVNRALAPGWNIWCDQTDSLAQRDTGWIQLYCEDAQEALDTILMAFRLAESVNLPVMVNLDAFYLSHTLEPVDVPDPEPVERFLPPYVPRIVLDTGAPQALGQMAGPAVYMEMRRDIQQAMEAVPGCFDGVEAEFKTIFERSYGAIEAVNCEDAEIVLVVTGTVAGTARETVKRLRARGEKAGLLKLKRFRPFPLRRVRQVLASVRKVAVIDRNFSFGASGIFAQEIRAALCNQPGHPPVYGYVAGLGGRDITAAHIEALYERTRDAAAPEAESLWVGLAGKETVCR